MTDPAASAGAPVRALTRSDIDAFATLRAAALAESPWAFAASPDDDRDARDVMDALDPNGNVINAAFVSERADAPMIAFAGIFRATHRKSSHLATVWGVYTLPAHRGAGLARRVVGAAIDTARAWDGVAGVCLSVSARTEPAIGLYRSLGFVEWGREPDATRIGEESADEIHMRLTLRDPPANA